MYRYVLTLAACCILIISYFNVDKVNIYQRMILDRLFGIQSNQFYKLVCKIPVINKIKKNSIVIIGHPYGSGIARENEQSLFPEKIESFLENNKYNIKILIISGDTFLDPSKKKWSDLFKKFGYFFEIHISPGNHDIGSENLREIFETSVNKLNKYPYSFNYKDQSFVIKDSYSSEWIITDKTLDLLNDSQTKHKYLIMHNIPVRELITSANSQEAMSRDLPYLRSLYRKLKGGSNITIFAGDSGALNHHPRSQCIDYLGLKIILNGIGGYDNDSIIVLNNEKLHSYIL